MDTIKKIDFLGQQIELTYQSETRTKTVLGGLMSLTLICLSLAAIAFFGKEIVFKEEPIVAVTEDFSRENIISLEEVPIMFTLNEPSGEYLVGTGFMDAITITGEFTVFSYDNKGQASLTINTLAFEPCSKELMSQTNYELLSSEIPLEYFICINPNYYFDPSGNKIEEKLYFQNTFAYGNSAFISIFISPCNEKAKPDCRKELDLNSTFYITRYYATSYFNLNSFDNPLIKYGNSLNNLISKDILVRNYTRFTINTLKTDSGFIFKDESSESFFTVEKEYQNLGFTRGGTQPIAEFYHEVSFIKNVYSRRYIKVQEVLANVGGFLKACFLVASLVIRQYSKYTFLMQFSKEVEKNTPARIQVDLSIVRANNSISTAVAKNVGLKLSFFEYLKVFWKESRRSKFNLNRYFKHLDLSFISEKLIQIDNPRDAM